VANREVDADALARMAVKHLPELEAELIRRNQYKIKRYFQDEGPYRRELYPKALKFFAAGAIHRERAAIAANRIGKTDMGSFEATLHLTGEYPEWWEGKRFTEPIRAWAAGTTGTKTKDIIQAKLLGPDTARGTGMIPARAIHDTTPKSSGEQGAIGTIYVYHKPTGGLSIVQLKSYAEGRASFEGTEQHLIWLDEEPPLDVYTECLLRTMATGEFAGGIMMMTFTPLEGQSDVVNRFTPGGSFPANGVIEDDKFEVMQRDAR
jgi:phage terminase large subunit-like protein